MSDIRVGLIGGSGLGDLLHDSQSASRRHTIETPFGPPSDTIIETELEGLPLFALPRHGPGHLLNPTQVPYRANIFALKTLGVTHIIASGAVGSLREEFRPRDLVIPDQIIDKTSRRPATFFERTAVHTEFAEPFCPVLRQILLDAAESTANHNVHGRGCYVCMEGPAFSTRAESLMHRLWGGDLIGMTCMPEAKLAREAEISYALVALVTDYDCWRTKPRKPGETTEEPSKLDLLSEIIGHLKTASGNAMALIRRAVTLLASRRETLPPSPAHSALELAIWSDKAQIDKDEVQRLSPLWIKYFGETNNGADAAPQ